MLFVNSTNTSHETYRIGSHCEEDAKGTRTVRPDDERPYTQRALVGGEVTRGGTLFLPVNRTPQMMTGYVEQRILRQP